MELDSFEQMVQSCILITRLNVSHNLNLTLINQFKKVLNPSDILLTVDDTNKCFVQVFQNIDEESLKSDLKNGSTNFTIDSEKRSLGQLLVSLTRDGTGAGSLLATVSQKNKIPYDYKENDQENIKLLLSTIAKNKNINISWMENQTSLCKEKTTQKLLLGLKGYIARTIPALYKNLEEGDSSVNWKVFDKVVDFDLLEAIIKFQSLKADKDGNFKAKGPLNSRVITPVLGLESLANAIKIIGNYLSKGFVYDSEEMRTQLVLLGTDIKLLVKHLTTTNEKVTVADVKEFFTNSTVVDHLSYAVIADHVYKQLMKIVISIEKEDFHNFSIKTKHLTEVELNTKKYQDEWNEYLSLQKKSKRLRSLVSVMTKSYDFKRIIEGHKYDSNIVISKIKNEFLLEKLLGNEVSYKVKRSIAFLIANLIIKDTTEGGFVEQFVYRVAEQKLSVESNKKWGLSKWIFYQKGDFDWIALRKTAAGRSAIDYYAQYILLPKILNSELGDREERVRRKEFEKRLRKAQKEN